MEFHELTPEQQHAVEYACDPTSGRQTTAISGPAGSGKSLVAMEIAERLRQPRQAELHFGGEKPAPGPQQLYFVTYTNELCQYVKQRLGSEEKSDSDEPIVYRLPDDIEVLTVHAYLSKFLRLNGLRFNFNGGRNKSVQDRRDFLADFTTAHHEELGRTGCLADPDFLNEEIGWLLGCGIRSRNAYLEADRTGRRTRLTKNQRNKVYMAYAEYMKSLDAPEGKIIDFDDIGNQVLHLCEKRKCPPIAKHLIVDEVQDLPKTWVEALRATVAPGGKIVFAGDTRQSIYGRGFTWKGVIGERVRPIHLKEDFRNTQQIYEAARSLMDFDDTPDADATHEDQQRPNGAKPQLFLHSNTASQAKHIRQLIGQLQQEGGSIALAFPLRNAEFREFKNEFGNERNITVTTLHSLKGLEADHVILANLDASQLDFDNEYTQEDTNRHLLYVGMTRAKRTLTLMCASPQPVWVLSELDFNLVEVHADENPDAYRNLSEVRSGRRRQAREHFEDAVDQTVQAEAELEQAQQQTSEDAPTGQQPEPAPSASQKQSTETPASEPADSLTDQNAKLERDLKRAQEKLQRAEDMIRVYRAREEAATKVAPSALGGDAGNDAAASTHRHMFVEDAKILILGMSSGVKKKDLAGIFKGVGLPREAYKVLEYDDVHSGKFDPRDLLDNVNYSDIFVSTTPHKARGIGDASSLVEWLRSNQDSLPKLTVFQNEDGTLKAISKTDLKEALYKSDLYAAQQGM